MRFVVLLNMLVSKFVSIDRGAWLGDQQLFNSFLIFLLRHGHSSPSVRNRNRPGGSRFQTETERRFRTGSSYVIFFFNFW